MSRKLHLLVKVKSTRQTSQPLTADGTQAGRQHCASKGEENTADRRAGKSGGGAGLDVQGEPSASDEGPT